MHVLTRPTVAYRCCTLLAALVLWCSGTARAQTAPFPYPVWLPDGTVQGNFTEAHTAADYRKARIQSIRVWALWDRELKTDSSLQYFQRYTPEGDALPTGLPLEWGIRNEASRIDYDPKHRKVRMLWARANLEGCGFSGHARSDTRSLVTYDYAGGRLAAAHAYYKLSVGQRYDTAYQDAGLTTYTYDKAGRILRRLQYNPPEGADTGGTVTTYRYDRRGRLLLELGCRFSDRRDLARADSLWALLPDTIAAVLLRQSDQWRDSVLASWLPMTDNDALTAIRDSLIDIQDGLDKALLARAGLRDGMPGTLKACIYDAQGRLAATTRFYYDNLCYRDTLRYDARGRVCGQQYRTFACGDVFSAADGLNTADAGEWTFTYGDDGRLQTTRHQTGAYIDHNNAGKTRPDKDVTARYYYSRDGRVQRIETATSAYSDGLTWESAFSRPVEKEVLVVGYEEW